MTVSWDEMVVVGTIARPHGLRGQVIVQPETDFPEDRFRHGAVVFLAPGEPGAVPRPISVKEARPHLGRLLVAFDGLERLEDAEALGRGELRVPPDALAALPPGHYYLHDLVGCAVTTVDGEPVGPVVRVEGGGAVGLLVVRGRFGEVLVPMAEEICVSIDLAARRIVVAPPEGLLELNAAPGGAGA
jgi:16S rRNA processing protein RimM